MDQRICKIKKTARLLHGPIKTIAVVNHSNKPQNSEYCTKSFPKRNNDSLIQHVTNKASASHRIQLKSAGQQLRAVFPQARSKDFTNCRVNELNIQMLSQPLYEQIFRKTVDDPAFVKRKSDSNLIQKAKSELQKHGLWTEKVNSVPDVSIKLPELKGKNIEEHFWYIGQEQSEPYKKLMCQFIQQGIPQLPKQWVQSKGWTKYKEGEPPCSVHFPDEDALVLDVEVSVKVGEAPVLATAVSADCWYGWVSPSLIEELGPIESMYYTTDMLIPLEGDKKNRPRVVIGHNVSYDRARIKEQYHLKPSALRFVDTMSLHICVGGASSEQKTILKNESNDEEEKDIIRNFCLTSLKDVYLMYCNAEMSKDERKVFTEGSLEDVRNNFEELMTYCAKDVMATYEVFQVLFPIYLERFPHPVTLAGMLEMGMAYLTVNSNWEKYLKDSQEKFGDLESEMSFLLAKKCDNSCRLLHGDEYKNDLWLWNEDWSTQELKLTKKPIKDNPKVEEIIKEAGDDEELISLMRKFKYLYDFENKLPAVKPILPGYPAWYRKLCRKPDSPDWVPGPQSLHTTLTIAPKILNLTYENYPLYFVREFGWGILVADLEANPEKTSLPFEKLKNITLKNLCPEVASDIGDGIKKKNCEVTYYNGTALWCGLKVDNCSFFFKLPHKDGNRKNVGQPLSKAFSSVTSSKLLSGSDSTSQQGLKVNNMLSYWRNNRDRITSQMVVWLKPEELPSPTMKEPVGVIIPKLVVCGTLTRRAVESTWLTASRSEKDRLGSELRAMVQAPPGYHFVGADVDSQELWIASLIGDSHFAKVHGGTPFGWMTISGTKLNGTDLHSVTAKATGISREHAKVMNYARIYGAGVRFAEKLLQQFNPSMPPKDVREKAKKMYALTKGIQSFQLKEKFVKRHKIQPTDYQFYSLYSAMNFAKKFRRKVNMIFENRKWKGGTESAVFNELEKIAGSQKPQTPFLGSRLSRALEPRFEGDDLYMNTRINWVVQSGAVDFLHLMLVCMRWLTGGQARYSLSFHDEVRYLVPSQQRYQAALAVQITNLLTRSFFAHRMGLYDLPLSVAFFSSVEVDKTMRKEANDDCVTPSNPHGLEKGYGVSKGESLNIYEAVALSGGDISVFKKQPEAGMSQATKRKHVFNEILQNDFINLSPNQQIVRIKESKGNNLHEVESPNSETFLVSMPSKFRKTVWVKKGDYIVVEPIEEGDKVKAEMVKPLSSEYIKYLKSKNQWPVQFQDNTINKTDDSDETFVNPNRRVYQESSSDESESETEVSS